MRRLALVLLFFSVPAFAQTWSETFQSPPQGWTHDGAFRTWPDPAAQGNTVYGARQPSSRDSSS